MKGIVWSISPAWLVVLWPLYVLYAVVWLIGAVVLGFASLIAGAIKWLATPSRSNRGGW